MLHNFATMSKPSCCSIQVSKVQPRDDHVVCDVKGNEDHTDRDVKDHGYHDDRDVKDHEDHDVSDVNDHKDQECDEAKASDDVKAYSYEIIQALSSQKDDDPFELCIREDWMNRSVCFKCKRNTAICDGSNCFPYTECDDPYLFHHDGDSDPFHHDGDSVPFHHDGDSDPS